MADLCGRLHMMMHDLQALGFPVDVSKIPLNGIYIMFEEGEIGHGMDRIVRVGTHTGDNQLPSRLLQHYVNENKDRSIFRKHIGRALLSRDGDPFLQQWNLDLTTSAAKKQYGGTVDFGKQRQVEKRVTEYLQRNLRFVCFPVDDKSARMKWESRIISTVSWCDKCGPSAAWLGLHSPNAGIRESGLWNINGLYKTGVDHGDCGKLCRLMADGGFR